MNRTAAWTAFAAWAAAVWWLSSRSHPTADLHWPWQTPDKVAHGVTYAAGGCLAYAALVRRPEPQFQNGFRVSPFLAAVLLCAVWGFTDEIHQGFVPGRSTDPADLAADVVGAALGAGVGTILMRRVTRSERSSR